MTGRNSTVRTICKGQSNGIQPGQPRPPPPMATSRELGLGLGAGREQLVTWALVRLFPSPSNSPSTRYSIAVRAVPCGFPFLLLICPLRYTSLPTYAHTHSHSLTHSHTYIHIPSISPHHGPRQTHRRERRPRRFKFQGGQEEEGQSR